MKGALREGVRVRFLNEAGEGVVKQLLKGNWVIVESDDGFDYKYPGRLLVVIEQDGDEVIANAADELDQIDVILQSELRPRKKPLPKRKKSNVLEVDLHMQNLIDDAKGLSNSNMLHIQLDHAQEVLATAMQARCTKIVFIHGVGEGILKTELRRLLSSYEDISFHDGSYSRYGMGATEVHIRYH